MILTNCAACAAPLAHNLGKKCSRCKTRYCNEACQRQRCVRAGDAWRACEKTGANQIGFPEREEDLRRQGYDLNESGEEDESPGDEEDGEDGSGYPDEDDRGDGSGVAAAMLAQMAAAGVEVPTALASSYGLS